MGHDNGTSVKTDAGDAGHCAAGTDGLTNLSDASSRHGNVPGTRNGMDTSADMKECISAHQDTVKQPISPIKPERRPIHDQVEPRNHTVMPNMQVGMHGVSERTNIAGDMQ